MSSADPANPGAAPPDAGGHRVDAESHVRPPVSQGPFVDDLRRRLDEQRDDAQCLALLVVDFGLIGRVDALYGYDIGDAVRGRLVATLRDEVLRPGDIIGDLGREDAACVLTSLADPQMALLAADKLRGALHQPLWLGDDEVFASPAIGITIHQGRDGNALSLLRQAKSACVTAAGLAGRVASYEAGQDMLPARLTEEGRLRSAIEADTLEMVLQPQFDLRFGQIMGMESLLRWRDGTRALVSMRDAVAAAEAGGLVEQLISSVLNRALRNCGELRQKAGLDLRVAVNLPARALLIGDLPDLVERSFRTWALRPGRLMLEIDDIAELQSNAAAQAAIRKLHELGVKLSMDDSGESNTSHASLYCMVEMPFSEMKIDLSILTRATPDWLTHPRSGLVVQSQIEMGHRLDLQVVAFNVPDEASTARLVELGCDFLQAEFRGPPVDPEDFVVRYAS